MLLILPSIQASLNLSGRASGTRDLVYAGTPVHAADARDQDAAPPQDNPVKITQYRVTGVILIIWLGLGAYLYLIDRRVTRLEKKIDEN